MTFTHIQGFSFAVACLLGLELSPITKVIPLQRQKVTTLTQLLHTAESVEVYDANAINSDKQHIASQSYTPPVWLALPFIVLLLMIATGPILYAAWWHQYYPTIAMLLAFGTLAYYGLVLHDWEKPIAVLADYIQFVALIAALYMAAGGILVRLNQAARPHINLGILFMGAIIANLIGTTGASMLLIRPYIRLNSSKVSAYHVVFFIFMVSNVGGGLTPIGDPPLFLGFLSGVPFFWALRHNFVPWLIVLLVLGAVFYYIDSRHVSSKEDTYLNSNKPTFQLVGQRNLIWFILIIGTVFIDPNIFDWVPAMHYGHHAFSFVRELILLGVAWFAYRYADQHVLQENEFSLDPLKEVALLFVGIFSTMIPALQLVSAFAHSATGQAIITHNTLYWGTGVLSSVLDNAPTYLNFSAASMAAQGADISVVADVKAFAQGNSKFHDAVLQLKAISVASVFFGAMTYIGNGPNFMVKAIAEHAGVRMPSFWTYVLHFSVPILLPTLCLVWLLCFAFA